MRSHSQLTDGELGEAHQAADMLIREKYRPYLPSPMLAMLLRGFRDDLAKALGIEPPLPPQRLGPVSAARLDDLTSSELDALSGAVLTLVTRFTSLMDDPVFPRLLRDFRDALVIEKADRARIADQIREKAAAS